jgi:ribonuclease P protein component
MLKKADRLTTQEVTALSQGKSVFGTLLSLRFRPADKAKFAVAVSKKVSNRAVDRNALRRKVYSILVDSRKTLIQKAFVMIIPKKEALKAPSADVQKDINSTLAKAGLR